MQYKTKLTRKNKRPKILTWHVHGSYLYYLTQTNADFYLPIKNNGEEGYGGKAGDFPWKDNVYEISANVVKNEKFDIILFQSKKNYLEDRNSILSDKQKKIPCIYLEHDPPREIPTDTKHIIDNPDILLVHVTHFNKLMWDNNITPTAVIEHGVIIPGHITYTGKLNKGIVVINNLQKRGRRLGLDIFQKIKQEVQLDLVGMGSKELGGLGEIPHDKLPKFISQYRFFFNPIRYTSLGLSICEAMMIGMPIIGLATTEMPVTIENGISGYVHTDINYLVNKMKKLITNPEEAYKLSQGAKKHADIKFNIHRFTKDWENVFHNVMKRNLLKYY